MSGHCHNCGHKDAVLKPGYGHLGTLHYCRACSDLTDRLIEMFRLLMGSTSEQVVLDKAFSIVRDEQAAVSPIQTTGV